jgi:squalene synthase HpnC
MAGILSEPERLRAREKAENFPVAWRLLPRNLRVALHALYATARVIDDIGDRADGDRTAQLLDVRTDLARIWNGDEPNRPVLRRLVPTVRQYDLPEQPFQDLIEANLKDQNVTRYPDFDALVGYCRLSANPIGRLVLAIFGQTTPGVVGYSDQVCTALQLLEHWQDVGEDYRAGRIYLPADDMAAHGVTEDDVSRATATPALRELMRFEIDRAEAMLTEGAALVPRLRGWARVSVAGFVAGGQATARALRATDGDVLGGQATPRRTDIALAAVRLLAGAAAQRGEDEQL